MVKFIEKELENGEISLKSTYDNNFKEQAFWVWYNAGQISASRLLLELEKFESDPPALSSLGNWIVSWRERAEELDQEVKDKFSAEVVQTKVEMLHRHASIGKELQDIGIEWLRDNMDSLTAAAVTRLIKDGYEMERASVGVPEALTKMLSVSDEDLKKQIEAALTGDDIGLFDAN